MFGRSRATQEAFDKIVTSVLALTAELKDGRGGRDYSEELAERVEGLELSRAKWEGEVEGLVLKAKGQYQAASAAESRARTKAKHEEPIAVEEPPRSEEEIEAQWAEYFSRRNGETSEEERVQPVPVGLENSGKAIALRSKFQ
jgi:hypothetical protein